MFSFRHRDAPEHHAVLLPKGADPSLADSAVLWNLAEGAERRKDSQVAREIVLALPANAELGPEDRRALAHSFALTHFVAKGLAVQLDIHAPHAAETESERANWHAHLLITTRRVEGAVLSATKARDLDPEVRQGAGGPLVSEAEAWGATWRDHQNRFFREAGLEIRVDATSAVPGEHIGPVRMRAPEAAANARAEEIRQANAAAARDPDRVLEVLTRNTATFTERELDRHLRKFIPDEAEFQGIRTQVLGSSDVLDLCDRVMGERVGRYTTRGVRQQELAALADAVQVAAGRHRDLGQVARAAAPACASLRPDQQAAFAFATGAGGFKILMGRAGTGKSFTLGAVRDAHAAAGYQVVGLAPTNAVAQDLLSDGFARSSTVHAELFRLKNGHVVWDRRTLVVVDEAAMVDSKILGALLVEARLAGAKLVLAGDDRQLASIERGGLFSELTQVHGAAEIRQVTRQKVDWQRTAAEDLAEGRFEAALRSFARHDAVVWTRDQEAARAALVARWTQDSAVDPSSSRFVFAYTNVEVDLLNMELRQARRERGELGIDHVFTTKHGEASFAVGDRVQITETLKAAGLYNGNAGVILAIDGETGRIDVRLDAPGEREGRVVSWAVSEFIGFRLGYAGTIYKGQGKSLDYTYLLHSSHWRAASAYVALTRQRLGATVFAATETAADLRQLARQIGRAEVKAASLAYATENELTFEQRQLLQARPQVAETAQAEGPSRVEGVAQAEAVSRSEPTLLIPPFTGHGRDSLGRGLDARSLTEAVATDAAVLRNREERGIYIQSAYRDPGSAMERLDALVALDGATSAARRIGAEPGLLGALRGSAGVFASAGSRAERRNALAATAAIGPSLIRTVRTEAQVLQGYRASVEAQNRADATTIPALSPAALTALKAAVANDRSGAGEPASERKPLPKEILREHRAFRAAVEARLGEDGARALLRGEATLQTSIPQSHRRAFVEVGRLYRIVRESEIALAREAASEVASARSAQSIRIKP